MERDETASLSVAQWVRVRVPSKLNLFLTVRGRRDDGMHELVSIMQTVSLYDTVTATLSDTVRAQHPAARRYMGLDLQHDADTNVPVDERNLAVRAARRLLTAIGAEPPPDGDENGGIVLTHLDLHKEIPVAAGMGGGSADAAAALIACNRLWGCGLDLEQLRDLAADVGADVPFCVTGGTALATGTGTATARVLSRGRFWWVVGISDDPLSTAEVYRAWDQVGEVSRMEPDAVLQALRTGDVEALGAALHNDLEPATFHLRPALREQHELLAEAGSLGVVVSGSGPTIVALAESSAHAGSLAGAVAGAFDRVEVACSPVGGPEVLAGDTG